MKKRNGEIDFLKFLFSLMIILFHSKNFAEWYGQSPFVGGAIAVSFFFIVSGYLFAQSTSKIVVGENEPVGPPTMKFLWKKIKGFLPNIYVAWIIAFIVECYVNWEGNFIDVLENALYGVFELMFVTQAGFIGEFRANAVTWYISALLLVMAFYFPFLVREKKRKTFLTLVAPLLAIFIFGYVFANYNAGFGPPSKFVDLMTKGLLRGFAEIALGCVCWALVQKLKELNTTKTFRLFLSGVAFGSYLFVFLGANMDSRATFKTLMTLAIAVGVTISFSGQTIWNEVLSKPVFSKLGVFSFDLYLSHGFWTHAMRIIFPSMPYEQLLVVYLIIVFITALFVMLVSKWILHVWPGFIRWLKSKMLLEQG